MHDMNQPEDHLTETLEQLGASAPQDAPPEIGAKVKSAFRKYHVRRRRIRAAQWTILTSALVLAVFVSIKHFQRSEWTNAQKQSETFAPANSAVLSAADSSEKFIPLPTFDPDIPASEFLVVRMELPQNELSFLGMPAGMYAGSSRVRADVLMDQDGTPYAVHVLDQ